MKKSIAIVLLLCLTLATVAGCSTAPAAASPAQESAAANKSAAPEGTGTKKTEITFFTYNLNIASQKEAAQELIDTFNAMQDKVHVTGVGVDVTTLVPRLQSDYAAGIHYDVVQVALNMVDYNVENYSLSAFEDMEGQAAFDAHMDGFVENAKTLGKYYKDGKTYVLPYTFSTPMLYYNADLFRAAGLDPDKPPQTWSDVKEYGIALKEAGFEGIQICGTGAAAYDWVIQAMIYSDGGEVVNEDKTEILFGGQGAVDAVTMWQDLRQSGAHTSYTDDEGTEAFMAGNQGMIMQSAAAESGYIASATAGGWDLRATMMPSFEGKEPVPTNSGSGLAIMSEGEEKAKAAWEFIKFITSAEGYTIITSKMGYLPLRPAILDDEQYLKEWAEAHPFVRTNLGQLENLRPWTSFPGMNSSQIVTILNQAVNKCVFTDGDVAEILSQAQQQAQDLLPPS